LTWQLARNSEPKKAGILRSQVSPINRSDARKVVEGFHTISAVEINPARFLKSGNNDVKVIRQAWKSVPLSRQYARISYALVQGHAVRVRTPVAQTSNGLGHQGFLNNSFALGCCPLAKTPQA